MAGTSLWRECVTRRGWTTLVRGDVSRGGCKTRGRTQEQKKRGPLIKASLKAMVLNMCLFGVKGPFHGVI